MLGLTRFVRPAPDRSGIDRNQLGKIRLADSGKALLQLMEEAATIRVCAAHKLVERVADDMTHPLDPDQGRLESVEIVGICGHGIAHVDESRVKRRPLLITEVCSLKLGLQVGKSLTDVCQTLVCRSVYLGVAGYLVEGFLKCSLDPLDLGVDLDQSSVLGVSGGRRCQPVSFLSVS